MQSVSSRIWTRVAVFISYDDNNYTTGTFKIQIEFINKEVLLNIDRDIDWSMDRYYQTYIDIIKH